MSLCAVQMGNATISQCACDCHKTWGSTVPPKCTCQCNSMNLPFNVNPASLLGGATFMINDTEIKALWKIVEELRSRIEKLEAYILKEKGVVPTPKEINDLAKYIATWKSWDFDRLANTVRQIRREGENNGS